MFYLLTKYRIDIDIAIFRKIS